MKVILIDKCDECPFFIPSWEENCKETCKKANFRTTPRAPETGMHPTPDWCDLDDYNDNKKEEK